MNPSLGYWLMSAFLGVLLVFLRLSWHVQLAITRLVDHPPQPANLSAYDFVVVGSGSAGSVVAGRLLRAGHSVLILEAGGQPHPLQAVPMLFEAFIVSGSRVITAR